MIRNRMDEDGSSNAESRRSHSLRAASSWLALRAMLCLFGATLILTWESFAQVSFTQVDGPRCATTRGKGTGRKIHVPVLSAAFDDALAERCNPLLACRTRGFFPSECCSVPSAR